MTDYTHAYHSIRQQIVDACALAHRDPHEVMLLAVSKRQSVDAIKALYALGQRDFGENQVQEALVKMEALKGLDIRWHFIGPIQTNKAHAIAEHFDWVHSICREKEAEYLSRYRPAVSGPLNICLQVNTGAEAQKNGLRLHEGEILSLAEDIRSKFSNLKMMGLMTIPPEHDDPTPHFNALKALLSSLQTHGFPLYTLSMGMSRDILPAVLAGSTCLRIGQGLFGKRAS